MEALTTRIYIHHSAESRQPSCCRILSAKIMHRDPLLALSPAPSLMQGFQACASYSLAIMICQRKQERLFKSSIFHTHWLTYLFEHY